MEIDVDGSGPLKPFPVTCEFLSDGRVMTILHHSNEHSTPVDGFEESGSFIQDINYDADLEQIEALLNRSISCRQRINYACKHSRLFNSPGNYVLNISCIFFCILIISTHPPRVRSKIIALRNWK